MTFRSCFRRPVPGVRISLVFALLTLSSLFLIAPSAVYAQWEPDVRLTFDPSEPGSNSMHPFPTLSVQRDTVHVVWNDPRADPGNYNYEIYYKRSENGGTTWSPDTRLTYAPGFSQFPELAVVGRYCNLVWGEAFQWEGDPFYKRSTDGGRSWSQNVRMGLTSHSGDPDVAGDSEGNVHVAFPGAATFTSPCQVYYRRSTDEGTSWSDTIPLTPPCPNNLLYPKPKIEATRTGLHLWYPWTDGLNYRRSSDRGSTWEPAVVIPGAGRLSNAAASDSFLHMVGYGLYGTRREEILYLRSTDGGSTWEPTVVITPDDGVSSGEPDITVSGSLVHVVWYDMELPSGRVDVYYMRSADGGSTWGPVTRLTNAPSTQSGARIAVSGPVVHVVWGDFRDGNWEVYYKRNRTGNSVGVETSDRPLDDSTVRQLTATPNPFTSFARVSGREQERFALFDISGRKLGPYRGDRIGEGLTAGVYFLKAEDKEGKPVRVVKVR